MTLNGSSLLPGLAKKIAVILRAGQQKQHGSPGGSASPDAGMARVTKPNRAVLEFLQEKWGGTAYYRPGSKTRVTGLSKQTKMSDNKQSLGHSA